MRITIGCDEDACSLRDVVKAHLRLQNHKVSDFAPLNNEPVLFSDVEFKVAEAIMAGQFECGILLCSTGISMTISANKVQGGTGRRSASIPFRPNAPAAATTHRSSYSGARVIGQELAKVIIDRYPQSSFDDCNSPPGRSHRAVRGDLQRVNPVR